MHSPLRLWFALLCVVAVTLQAPRPSEACSPARGAADVEFPTASVALPYSAALQADAMLKRWGVADTTQDYIIILTGSSSTSDASSNVLGKALLYERMVAVRALLLSKGVPEERILIDRARSGSENRFGVVELEFTGFFGCAQGSSISFPSWPAE